MAGSKNLGQVAGVYIGNTPPDNIILLWYDNTPSQMCHKVYDAAAKQWVILDQKIISVITYSELVNIAQSVGLSIGKFYKITDRGNALAIAITTTKVQYDDSLGNILIDDLGTNIQYHVTSSNLQIDDVAGVFDTVNRKLVFQFNEMVPDMTIDDYIFGKVRRNNTWSLAKYKLSSFLSKVTGNSITWNGGFFFDFLSALKGQLDKKGGVVAKDSYDKDMEALNTSIGNVGKENQQITQNYTKAIEDATTPTAIYDKQLPTDPVTGGEAIDVAKGDALSTIISKLQRFINKFKYATGIMVSQNFTAVTKAEKINNNDTVDSALRKVQYWLNNIGSLFLSETWEPKDYAGTITDIQAGDSIDEAFAKAQGKLNQIGDISNGQIQSKAKVNGSDYTRRTILNLLNGSLTFNRDVSGSNSQQSVTLSKDAGLSTYNAAGYNAQVSADGLYMFTLTNRSFSLPGYEDPWGFGTLVGASSLFVSGRGTNPAGYVSAKIVAAIAATCVAGSVSGADVFDAYFQRLKAGVIAFGRASLKQSDLWLDNNCSFVTCTNTENKNLYLPSSPLDGQMVIVNQVNSANVAVQGNGRKIVDNEDVDYVNVGGARRVAVFLYHGALSSSGGSGAWLFFRWSR